MNHHTLITILVQAWRAFEENPFVKGLRTVEEIRTLFKVCRKLFSLLRAAFFFVRDAVVLLWAIVLILRSPKQFAEAFFQALQDLFLPSIRRFALYSAAALGIGAALWLLCCRPCSRQFAA
jgi:hypothetical protein